MTISNHSCCTWRSLCRQHGPSLTEIVYQILFSSRGELASIVAVTSKFLHTPSRVVLSLEHKRAICTAFFFLEVFLVRLF